MARIEEGLVGGFNSRDFDEKRIIGEIIGIFEIICTWFTITMPRLLNWVPTRALGEN